MGNGGYIAVVGEWSATVENQSRWKSARCRASDCFCYGCLDDGCDSSYNLNLCLILRLLNDSER